MTEILNEVFDENAVPLPITNLYPKTKIPQIFAIDHSKVAFRFCSYTGGGDSNRNIKPGDKMMHAVILGVTDKGLGQLKNLGEDPIGVINTVFSAAYQLMKQYKIDACMLRVKKNKTAGRGKQIQYIMDRLVRQKTGGRYVILKELYDFDKKYSYVFVYRKSAKLEDIPGVPEISTELFTKVESKVGDVYVDKNTGKNVTKTEAVAATLASENDARTDQAVAARAKISRRQLINAQYGRFINNVESTFAPEEKLQWDRIISNPNSNISANADTTSSELNTKINVRANNLKSSIANDIVNYKSITNYKSEATSKVNAADYAASVDNSIKNMRSLENPQWKEYMPPDSPMQSEVSSMIKEISQVIDSSDNLCDISVLRNIVEIATRNTKVPTIEAVGERRRYENSITNIVSGYVNMLDYVLTPVFENYSKQQAALSKEESDAVRRYCGAGFSDINDYLLGIEVAPNKIRESVIPNLDSAFDKGFRLNPGTVLYRGQRGKYEEFASNIESKIFYFQNFVSTSIKPIIFGGYSNSAGSISTEAPVADLDQDDSVDAVNKSVIGIHPFKKLSNGEGEVNEEIKIGMVIHGADKIKVIVPGDLSAFPDECEVILPRGLAMKINKVWGTAFGQLYSASNSKSYMIEMTIINPEDLNESTIYDGDALLESGEVKESKSFSTFFTESYKSPDKAMNREQYVATMGLLADCVNIDGFPEKFVQ